MQQGAYSFGEFPWMPYSGMTVGPRHSITLDTSPGISLAPAQGITSLPWLPYGRSVPLVYVPHDPLFTQCQFSPNANKGQCDALFGSAWSVYDEPEFD